MADGQSKILKESMSHIDQGLNLERKGCCMSAIPWSSTYVVRRKSVFNLTKAGTQQMQAIVR